MNKQKGHEGDVERLIEEHQPQLKAFIHRRVSSKEDAEDILQDVFYQLVKAVSNTLNPIEQVTSWLYRVTRNTIINKGKKKSEEEWPVSAYAEEESVLSEFSEVLFANDDLAPSKQFFHIDVLFWCSFPFQLHIDAPSFTSPALTLLFYAVPVQIMLP